MDIVVDTSILISVILNEPEKKNIISATSGHALIGPESIRWEITNAFSAMFKKKRITLSQASKALQIFDVIPIRYIDVDFKHSLKLSFENNIYAYDAYFLDCAIRHKAPLISLDRRMTATARDIQIKTLEI